MDLLARFSHQTNVSAFRLPVDEDDIGGFHVAMREAVVMKVMQRISENDPKGGGGKIAAPIAKKIFEKYFQLPKAHNRIARSPKQESNRNY